MLPGMYLHNYEIFRIMTFSFRSLLLKCDKSGITDLKLNIHGFPEEFKSGASMALKLFNLNGEVEQVLVNNNDAFKLELSTWFSMPLANNDCHLRAELTILAPNGNRTSQIPYEVAATQAMREHMSSLLIKGSLSDFVFVVKGDEFKVHKSILAAVSKVWERMFSADYKEKETSSCEIDHIEPEIFKAVLHFIYCAEIPENFNELVVKLFEAAHYFEIESLKEICLKRLRQNLSSTNAVDIYKIAYLYELDLLPLAWTVIKWY